MEQPVALIVAFAALVAVLFGLFASAARFSAGVWLARRAAEKARTIAAHRRREHGLRPGDFVDAVCDQGPILTFLGGVVAAAGVAGLAIGLAGIATMVGKRLTRQASGLSEILAGTTVLSLASTTPFFGWFVVTPALVFLGLGGFILGWFRRRAWSAQV
jgi:hypothetical protein